MILTQTKQVRDPFTMEGGSLPVHRVTRNTGCRCDNVLRPNDDTNASLKYIRIIRTHYSPIHLKHLGQSTLKLLLEPCYYLLLWKPACCWLRFGSIGDPPPPPIKVQGWERRFVKFRFLDKCLQMWWPIEAVMKQWKLKKFLTNLDKNSGKR